MMGTSTFKQSVQDLKIKHVKLLQSCSTLCDFMDYTCQAPLSMGFSRQEYWSELPFPLPGDLPNPGIKAVSLKSPALASIGSLPLALPGKPPAKTKHSQRIFFQGSENILYVTLMVNPCHHTFVKAHRLYSTKNEPWTSLVVQWLRICLPVQGMWV